MENNDVVSDKGKGIPYVLAIAVVRLYKCARIKMKVDFEWSIESDFNVKDLCCHILRLFCRCI